MSERVAYIAGPMSGIPQFNYPAFDECAKWLRANTIFEVINPAELDAPHVREQALASPDGDAHPEGTSWAEFLARDMTHLDRADTIILLEGWEGSHGAQIEALFAARAGKACFEFCADPHDGRRIVACKILGDIGTGLRVSLDDSDSLAEAVMRDPVDVLLNHLVEAAPAIGPRADATSPGEVRVTNNKTGGQKGRKPQRFELLPYGALGKIAEVYAYGALKYTREVSEGEFWDLLRRKCNCGWNVQSISTTAKRALSEHSNTCAVRQENISIDGDRIVLTGDRNWERGYDWSLSFGALQRHLAAWWENEDTDPESGLSHLAHAGFHILGLLHYGAHEKYRELDDRPDTTVETLVRKGN